jgi:hypothetical protein
LNPKAMGNKIRPSKVYTITNMSNVEKEKNYTTEEEAKNNPQWGENLLMQNFSIK